MARKRKTVKKEPSSKQLVSMEATAKKLQSLLIHPSMSLWVYSGAASGIRSRLLSLDFLVLRRVVHQIPILNAIINARSDQILPFCKRATEKTDDKGFEIIPVKGYKEKEKEVDSLYEFFEQTGFQYSVEREDDMMDYVQMFVRDVLTIDQIATEIQYNRLGEAISFWALDGAYIKRTTEEGTFPKNVRFVQEVDLKVYNQYTDKTLIFDYKNKRSDLRYRGFGYSYVEMAIDVITTLLFGYKYLRDQLLRDKVPKGFISVLGDVEQEQLDAIQRYWYAAMSGAGGRWNIPILPSGKEGVGLEWKNIQPSNKDMEYHKLMMFTNSICAAVFGIDLAELGIKTDDSQSIIGESGKPRIEASKDRGLGSLLSFLEQHLNKILRKVSIDYKLRFIGFEPDDEKKRVDINKSRLSTDTTINELRKEQGKDPVKEEYADVVLNEQAVQIYQASKQAEQAEQMGGGFAEEGEEGSAEKEAMEGGGELPAEGEEEGGEVDWQNLFKSRTAKKEKNITITIK